MIGQQRLAELGNIGGAADAATRGECVSDAANQIIGQSGME